MQPTFDPYHQWLGIRPEEHPVDHYRLLGIVRFENDRDVIANACDRLMSHVRTFQTGPRGRYTQEVMTRLAGARACLLNASAKVTYDAVLLGQLAAAATQQAASTRRTAPMASAYEPATAVLPPPPPTAMAPPIASDYQYAPTAAPPADPQRNAARGEPSADIEYVDQPTSFFFQPWFPVLVVAGVMLAALIAWGVGMMIARGREEAQQPPVTNPTDDDGSTTNPTSPDDDEPTDSAVYIRQEAGGELNFTAGTATLTGNPRLVELGGRSAISDIISLDDRLSWKFQVEKPGPFRVDATYSAPSTSAGGTFTLSAGEQKTKAITVRDTGAGSTAERVGFLWVRRAGKHELVLAPTLIVEGQPLMTFESLRLVPVGGSEGL